MRDELGGYRTFKGVAPLVPVGRIDLSRKSCCAEDGELWSPRARLPSFSLLRGAKRIRQNRWKGAGAFKKFDPRVLVGGIDLPSTAKAVR
jgi:hypothetical protein